MKFGLLIRSAACASWLWSVTALADPTTPGYPERVLQWTVEEGETCADISRALYGDPSHGDLVERYNPIACTAGKPLGVGTTLVLPEKVTTVPTANLRSMAPAVRARPAGGTWQPAAPGMPLYRNHNVNTLDHARADIRFVDRTRVVLAEHTLVIIFGTAGQTRVSRTDPAIVQLDQGEVEAGLAALAGRPVTISVQGGGSVDASSRDTVVRKKPQRATVSVFDGQARVRSGGQEVTVPERYGTSFQPARAPTPPRPLPPPAAWMPESTGGVLLGPTPNVTLAASWGPVDKAVAYRIEVATDPDFQDLVTREEVPAAIRTFRAENLPAGTYHLRVRAIDDEDFLGLSSPTLDFALVGYLQKGGATTIPNGTSWQLNPYGSLAFDAPPGVEVSFDGTSFQPLPGLIDLTLTAPTRLSFRMRGATALTDYRITYSPVDAAIDAKGCRPKQPCTVRVTLHGAENVDIPARVRPALRFVSSGSQGELPLTPDSSHPGSFSATLPASLDVADTTLLVLDRRGGVLGKTEPAEAVQPPAPSPAPPSPLRLGVDAPMLPLSTLVSAPWWSPAPRPSLHVAAAAAHTDLGTGALIHAQAVGVFGRFAIDALLPSPAMGDVGNADSGGWLGGRVRLAGEREGDVVVGAALRTGLPLASDGPSARIEAAAAAGATYGRFGWLANVGLRRSVEDNPSRTPTPDSQAYLLGGSTYDLAPGIRSWALLDSHLLDAGRDTFGRGGFAMGIEGGSRLFGGVGARVSAWDQAGGRFSAQLAFGARSW